MKQSYLRFKINDNVTLTNVTSNFTYEGKHYAEGTEMIIKSFVPNPKILNRKEKYSICCILKNGDELTLPHFVLVKNKLGWKVTDSDCNQWGRMVSPKRKRKAPQIFEFSELRWNGTENELYTSTIDLKDYIKADMESDINSFGYTLYKAKNGLLNIFDEYGTDAHWILAECIFELEN